MTGKHFIKLSALCFLLLSAAGCNDDIFVDGMDLPDVTNITIEGDGGEWKSTFSRDGLVKISIDPESSELHEYFRYFNKDGREVDADCPASELAEILYENKAQFFNIFLSSNIIEVRSNYNALPEKEMRLWLEYDSGRTKYITITIEAGEPLDFGGAWYKGEIEVEEDVRQVTRTTRFNNNSHLTQRMEIRPYAEAGAAACIEPSESWANLLTYDMAVLAYIHHEWARLVTPDFTIGQVHQFSLSDFTDDKIAVDVPPYTRAKVSYTLHYSLATEKGDLLFFNKVSDRQFEVDFTGRAAYPTGYDYTVEYEDL